MVYCLRLRAKLNRSSAKNVKIKYGQPGDAGMYVMMR